MTKLIQFLAHTTTPKGGKDTMQDIFYLAIVTLFFVAAIAYSHACNSL